MKCYYFTFGTDKNHPFKGGWVIVKARSMKDAEVIFHLTFPNSSDCKQSNFAFSYSESAFKNTVMYKNGNFGVRCHGIISFKALKQKKAG